MSLSLVPHRSRHLAWFLGALCLTLGWEALGADLSVMRSIGNPQGFPLHHTWLMATLLHEDLRWLAFLLYGLVWLWVAWPARWSRANFSPLQLPRRQRVWVGVMVTLCLLAINLIKRGSTTSCPWSLSEFGGVAAYVPHWQLWLTDGGPGQCFPAGHASAALAFVGLVLPWLEPVGAERTFAAPTTAWRWLLVIVTTGVFLGAAQTLRGAHYPSHTMWTLLICWGLSLALWRLAQPWLGERAASPAPAWASL